MSYDQKVPGLSFYKFIEKPYNLSALPPSKYFPRLVTNFSQRHSKFVFPIYHLNYVKSSSLEEGLELGE